MTFQEINEQLGIAQENYEIAVRKTVEATDKKEQADIEVIKSDSAYKKARLDLGLYDRQLKTLQEQSYNLRKETGLR